MGLSVKQNDSLVLVFQKQITYVAIFCPESTKLIVSGKSEIISTPSLDPENRAALHEQNTHGELHFGLQFFNPSLVADRRLKSGRNLRTKHHLLPKLKYWGGMDVMRKV